MSNEQKEIKAYEDLKSFLSDLVKDNPNDQILGSKIRYFMNNSEIKDHDLIVKELERFNC